MTTKDMNTNIEVKSIYSGWKKVTREQAKEFVLHVKTHASAIHPDMIVDYINKNKLRGITHQELMEDADEV